MKPQRDRVLLVSLHDVSPRFEAEVDGLLELLAPIVSTRVALLVVPNHWGDAPILAGSPFATKLRQLGDAGCEIFLHGYYHRDDARHARLSDRLRASLLTAREGEFLGLSGLEAQQRIRQGRDLIENVIGRSIAGFVAPAWLYGRRALTALEDLEIPIAESHWRVWSPARKADLARGPVITWATRSRGRKASSLVAASALSHVPARVLRVGVHPPDMRDPVTVNSISRTLAAIVPQRRMAAYRDLFPTAAA